MLNRSCVILNVLLRGELEVLGTTCTLHALRYSNLASALENSVLSDPYPVWVRNQKITNDNSRKMMTKMNATKLLVGNFSSPLGSFIGLQVRASEKRLLISHAK